MSLRLPRQYGPRRRRGSRLHRSCAGLYLRLVRLRRPERLSGRCGRPSGWKRRRKGVPKLSSRLALQEPPRIPASIAEAHGPAEKEWCAQAESLRRRTGQCPPCSTRSCPAQARAFVQNCVGRAIASWPIAIGAAAKPALPKPMKAGSGRSGTSLPPPTNDGHFLWKSGGRRFPPRLQLTIVTT